MVDLLLMVQLEVLLVDKLLNNVLLPNSKPALTTNVLLPSVLNKTNRLQLKLLVTVMLALLLNVSKLLMPPLLELLPAVPLLLASKPTALMLTATTAPLPTPTKLLLPQVVSMP